MIWFESMWSVIEMIVTAAWSEGARGGIRSQVWNIIDFSSCLFLVSDVCSGIGLLAMHILIFISRHGIKPIKRGIASKPLWSSESLKPPIQDIIIEEWRTKLTPSLITKGWRLGVSAGGRAGTEARLGLIMQAGLHFSTRCWVARQARALPFSSIFSIFTPILAAMPRLTSPLSWRSITHCLRIISFIKLFSPE